MTLIVAGLGRQSGKTTAVCNIIAATRSAHWTAVKVTPHGHGVDITEPIVLREPEAGPDADTRRYLAAGAERAFWVRCKPADIAHAVAPLMSGNVVLESNSAAGVVPADLILFVISACSHSKPSSGRARLLADVEIERVDADVVDRVRGLLIAPPR